jgi:acyl-CoA dehydrogenase
MPDVFVERRGDRLLSPATERLRLEVREWAVSVGRRFARECDQLHRLPEAMYAELPSSPIQANPYLGRLLNPLIAESEMGTTEDDSNVLGVVVTEALAYGDIMMVYLVGGSGIGSKVVSLLGTPEQVARWDRPDVKHTAFALTEPGCGSDAVALTTSAVRQGDSWVINGQKIFSSFGALAEYVVVFATVDRSQGSRGIRAFVVPAGTPGYRVARANEAKLGLRGSTTSELVFDNVVLPLDHCLGTEADQPHSFATAMRTFNTTRPTVAAQAIGIGQAAADLARSVITEHADQYTPARRERLEQLFDRSDAALDRARLLMYQAAWEADQGGDFQMIASEAKAYGCQVAERVCLRALQLMGSEGYSEQNLIEKWHRDIKITDIYEGTGNIHRLIVSRSLLKEAAGRSH